MREIIQLLKLTLEEKKRLILAFVFSTFAAFFTYLFVNLVQPIIDKMFLQETAQASAGKPGLIGVILIRL